MEFENNGTRNSQIALGFVSYNYLTVTGTIILELHSNMCDYLNKYNFQNLWVLNIVEFTNVNAKIY